MAYSGVVILKAFQTPGAKFRIVSMSNGLITDILEVKKLTPTLMKVIEAEVLGEVPVKKLVTRRRKKS